MQGPVDIFQNQIGEIFYYNKQTRQTNRHHSTLYFKLVALSLESNKEREVFRKIA